jgi:hypothetical protein
VESKSSTIRFNVKFWEVIADNLSKAGWSWGCVATIDSNGQTISVADAHRDDGKRFVMLRQQNSKEMRGAIPSIGRRSYRKLSEFHTNSVLPGMGVKAEGLSPGAFFPFSGPAAKG